MLVAGAALFSTGAAATSIGIALAAAGVGWSLANAGLMQWIYRDGAPTRLMLAVHDFALLSAALGGGALAAPLVRRASLSAPVRAMRRIERQHAARLMGQARYGNDGDIVAALPCLDDDLAAIVFGGEPLQRSVQRAMNEIADKLEGRDVSDAQARGWLRPVDAIGEDRVTPVAPIYQADKPFAGFRAFRSAYIIRPKRKR